jgi:hypothetical protein
MSSRHSSSRTILLPYAGGGATTGGRGFRVFFSVSALRASALGCRGTAADPEPHAHTTRRVIAQPPWMANLLISRVYAPAHATPGRLAPERCARHVTWDAQLPALRPH